MSVNPSVPGKPSWTKRGKKEAAEKNVPHFSEETPQSILRNELTALQEMAELLKTKAGKKLSVENLVRLVDVRGKTSMRLVNLLKAERQLGENGDPTRIIQEALKEITEKLGIE